MPIRLRIALLGAVVVILTVVSFSVLLSNLVAFSAPGSQDQQLVQASQRAMAFLAAVPADALAPQRAFAPIDVADSNDTFVEVLDAGGAPLVTTGTVGGAPPRMPVEVLDTATREGNATATTSAEAGVTLRVHVRPWSRPDLDRAGFLVVGQSTRTTQTQIQGTRTLIAVLAGLTLVAALIGIWIAAGRALQPLRLVAQTAEDIRLSGDLSRRLPEEARHDELGRLARSFNGMLARLQDAQDRLGSALDAQRRFVADASHELRTPLTTIRTNAGLLLSRPDVTSEDRRGALVDIASEGERMSRLVEGLLVLARGDAGVHLVRRLLQLDLLVAEIGRQAQQLHPDRKIRVDAEAEVVVCGDRDALTQLLWILLDNAARFTTDGGTIEVCLRTVDTQVELRVVDDGRGIPEADLLRIFDRFYQTDQARASGGAGLGLSIARWIVTEHNGHITATNRLPAPGAQFIITLPAAP